MRLINFISVFLIEILILSLLGKGNPRFTQKKVLIEKSYMHNDGRGDEETQTRVPEDGGKSNDSI
jgi:hypothetical protein